MRDDREIAEFKLPDGSTVLFEVEEIEDNSIERVSRNGRRVAEARQSFEQALDQVKPVADVVLNKLKGLSSPAKEVEIKLGIKLTAEAGAIFTSVGGEAGFEITLKWERDENLNS